MLYETLNLEEAEIVTEALNWLFVQGVYPKGHPAAALAALHDRLKRALQAEWRRMEPVDVELRLGEDAYLVKLNPVTNEVEVRHNGKPAMSGEWWRPWGSDNDDDVPPGIQRDREYAGMPQPDDDTLDVLSAAVRHALSRR